MAIKLTQGILKSRAMIGQIKLTISSAEDMPYDICVHMLSSVAMPAKEALGTGWIQANFF